MFALQGRAGAAGRAAEKVGEGLGVGQVWWRHQCDTRLHYGPLRVSPRLRGVHTSHPRHGHIRESLHQHVLLLWGALPLLPLQPGGGAVCEHPGVWLPSSHCVSTLVRYFTPSIWKLHSIIERKIVMSVSYSRSKDKTHSVFTSKVCEVMPTLFCRWELVVLFSEHPVEIIILRNYFCYFYLKLFLALTIAFRWKVSHCFVSLHNLGILLSISLNLPCCMVH